MRRTERSMTPGQASAVLQHGIDERLWGKEGLSNGQKNIEVRLFAAYS